MADIEVTLTTLVYGGEALGRLPDGRAVFVPRALPGERVRARVVETKRGHLRAELLEVLDPSPERIRPRCRHFGVCGGCHYQHVPYPLQLQAKADILRDQLRRIGKVAEPPVGAAVPSPLEWNYRNHVQFHLDAAGRLGYVGAATGAGVLAVGECHLPEAPLDALWPQLAFDPGLGLERVALRLGADGQILLVLESEDPRPPEVEIEADCSVVHLCAGEALVLAGEDHLVIEVEAGREPRLRKAFRVSAGSFFQVNTAMAREMVTHLLERLPTGAGMTALDVYAGVGLFSAYLAPHVGRLIAIESSPSACEDFAVNLDEFEHVELYAATAEEVLPALEVRPDVALVDPPRAGLGKDALEALLRLAPARLAYVSCDPATLARDGALLLAGGYHLVEVTPFDLFPQTFHIESISFFERIQLGN